MFKYNTKDKLLIYINMNVTKNAIVKIGSWTKKQVTSLDDYSKTMSFYINGKESISTFSGGIASILVKTGVLIVAILLSITVFQRGNTTKSINRVVKDITNDSEKHYFAK